MPPYGTPDKNTRCLNTGVLKECLSVVGSDVYMGKSSNIPQIYPDIPQTYPDIPQNRVIPQINTDIPQAYPDIPQIYPDIPQIYSDTPQNPDIPQTYPDIPQIYPNIPQNRDMPQIYSDIPQTNSHIPKFNSNLDMSLLLTILDVKEGSTGVNSSVDSIEAPPPWIVGETSSYISQDSLGIVKDSRKDRQLVKRPSLTAGSNLILGALGEQCLVLNGISKTPTPTYAHGNLCGRSRTPSLSSETPTHAHGHPKPQNPSKNPPKCESCSRSNWHLLYKSQCQVSHSRTFPITDPITTHYTNGIQQPTPSHTNGTQEPTTEPIETHLKPMQDSLPQQQHDTPQLQTSLRTKSQRTQKEGTQGPDRTQAYRTQAPRHPGPHRTQEPITKPIETHLKPTQPTQQQDNTPQLQTTLRTKSQRTQKEGTQGPDRTQAYRTQTPRHPEPHRTQEPTKEPIETHLKPTQPTQQHDNTPQLQTSLRTKSQRTQKEGTQGRHRTQAYRTQAPRHPGPHRTHKMVLGSSLYGVFSVGFLVGCLLVILCPSPTFAQVTGVDIGCYAEGDRVPVPEEVMKDTPCIDCYCQGGRVVCRKRRCPSLEGCYWKMPLEPGKCCQECKGCIHKGTKYPNGARWSEGCKTYHCLAGVLTITTAQCHVPCYTPLPPRPSECCPSCPDCWLEGRRLGEGEGVTSSADPCIKCRCLGGRVSCLKVACPVMSCPTSRQIKSPDGCCNICVGSRELITPPGGRCFLNSNLYTDGLQRQIDSCTSCTCARSYLSCQRVTCPVLNCSTAHQITQDSQCCPTCRASAHLESTCVLHGLTYQPGDTWQLDTCTKCTCGSGTVSCRTEPCTYLNAPCPPGLKRIKPENECCPKCVQAPGSCVVFGDPHYRTFDGLLYTFQGACRYTLAEECGRNTNFSIRINNDAPRHTNNNNDNDGNYARTRSLTLKLPGGVKVKMCPKLRTKVNGRMIQPPYSHQDVFNITKQGQALSLFTKEGIRIVWDGWSYTEVQVPTHLRGTTCGLCGNFNGNAADDLKTRNGRLVRNADKMAASWSTGRARQCRRRLLYPRLKKKKQDSKDGRRGAAPPPSRPRPPRSCQSSHNTAFRQCGLLNSTAFHSCHSVVKVDAFYESCIQDMCVCTGRRCECDTLLAYARQCQHLGIDVEEWREISGCGGLECARGSEYMSCAPPCRATCRNPTPNPRCYTRRCRAGCYCPPPLVLHRGACIPPQQCRRRRRRNRRRNKT